ncbi:hypothetical protein R3P38DRAFT_3238253 [Favolaschia claudopus]|uniref:Uncharacterized protein n=1 Tax=Favolaschia claudopus TaxID=2862362 RepID=A0AAV9ZAC7_9AGAR
MSPSLFSIDGPWNHALCAKASKQLIDGRDVTAVLEGFGFPADFVGPLAHEIVSWSTRPFDDLDSKFRLTALRFLRLSTEGNGVMNRYDSPAIRHGILADYYPDLLLYSADPAQTAPPRMRQLTRPYSSTKHKNHFLKANDWYQVLSDASEAHRERKKISKRPRTIWQPSLTEGRKSCLRNLSLLNSTSKPGDVAIYNLTQAAFMLRAMRHMVLTLESFIDLGLLQAREEDPSVTREEVEGVLVNPNVEAFLPLLQWLPVYLLSIFCPAKTMPAGRITLYWSASGNMQRVDLEHPLGKVERVCWIALLRLAARVISAEEAMDNIFDSAVVQSVLNNEPSEPQLQVLSFPDDTDLHTMKDMDPDDDYEVEMARRIKSEREREEKEKADKEEGGKARAGAIVERTFEYRMFKKFARDRNMIEAMLQSEPTPTPLFLQDSARNPDPLLQASESQSVLFVSTQKDTRNCRAALSSKSIDVVVSSSIDVTGDDEAPPPFDWDTMQAFRNPEMPCHIQDMGVAKDSGDACLRAGGKPFVCVPNMAFYMRPGTPHFVISLEDTIAVWITYHQRRPNPGCGVQCAAQLVTEGFHANAEHRVLQWLLVRMSVFWSELIPLERPAPCVHYPNIGTPDGLLDLLTLHCYLILYPALLIESYQGMSSVPGTFRSGAFDVFNAGYQEYDYALYAAAWKHPKRGREHTYTTLLHTSVVNMACCLVRYRTEWIERQRGERRESSGMCRSCIFAWIYNTFSSYAVWLLEQASARARPSAYSPRIDGDEDEPDAATLKECGSPEALAEWLAAVAGFLAPVVAHAKSLTIDSTTPLGVSAILTSIGVQASVESRAADMLLL